ncbi:MAG: caspase family protein [Planctomycetia bacterium]|nr:caspase family protein [Planctomycetia bacterium]
MCKFHCLSAIVMFITCVSINMFAEGKNIAILIGPSEYDCASFDASDLHIENDVRELEERFRNGMASELFDVHVLVGEKATKEKIESELKNTLALENCDGVETAIVFFSGHGMVSASDNERVLLAVKDSDDLDETTLLSAQWVREVLRDSGVPNCLFLIDACYSGGTKSAIDAGEVIEREEVMPGVLTLASSCNSETSGTWLEKEMSNFSYWLNEALKGYADRNRDGTICTEELATYVAENLDLKTKLQHPVLLKSEDTEHFDLCRPRARNIYSVLDDFADEIITYADLKGVEEISTDGFIPLSGKGTMRSVDFEPLDFNRLKTLSTFCTSELERRIPMRSKNKVKLAKNAEEELAVMDCTLEQKGKYYFLTCNLRFAEDVKTSAVNISQRVLTKATYETYVKPTPSYSVSGVSSSSTMTYNRNYVPCAVGIEVKDPSGVYRPRMMERINGQYYIALDEGEVYRIALQSYPQPGERPIRLGARILVDGRNLIPQALAPVNEAKFRIVDEPTQSDSVSGAISGQGNGQGSGNGQGAGVVATPSAVEAPILPMDLSHFFVLGGEKLDTFSNQNTLYHFMGFLKALGENAEYREFLVAPVDQTAGSVEHIGLITVGCHSLKMVPTQAVTRGTVEGQAGHVRAPILNGLTTDELLQMIHIRYVPSSEMEMHRQGGKSEMVQWAK